ncbi:MAG: hypothetical protein RL386_426 [Bacteroidota bacterium]
MKIELDSAGKRYRSEWVFRKVTTTFESPQRYAITGPNGAGKSTFMRLLSGYLTPSKGRVRFSDMGRTLDPAFVYKSVAFAAPYMELIEEFTLREALDFQQRFKPFAKNLSPVNVIERLGFQKSASKQIRFFSSGMKQRLRLALAICAKSDALLLDEPGSNLDAQGMEWYHALIDEFGSNRLIIVASNIPADYSFCQEILEIARFKL